MLAADGRTYIKPKLLSHAVGTRDVPLAIDILLSRATSKLSHGYTFRW
jgi:hypothetical protein